MAIRSNRLPNAVLGAFESLLPFIPGGSRAREPQNILVVRLGNLGDIIVALPAFHALRRLYPDARITLLTSPTARGAVGAVEVLANDRTFDDQVVYYADESQSAGFLKRLRGQIRERGIDLGVVLPNHLTPFASLAKYGALFAASGIRRAVGLRLVTPEDHEIRQVDRLVNLLRPLGPAEVEPAPWLAPADEDEARADAWLAQRPRPMVAMHPGAKRSANRWPVARFIEVGRRLIADRGATILLTGSPGERALTEPLREAFGANALDLTGRTTVGELAAILARCDGVVSNDTGVMHVAEAVGTPTVALFSARFYPNVWFPYGSQHVVFYRDIECSPCQKDDCPLYAEPECLNRIGVEEVASAVERLLSLGSAARPS